MPLAHDAFISYSHIDKPAADAACATLEAAPAFVVGSRRVTFPSVQGGARPSSTAINSPGNGAHFFVEYERVTPSPPPRSGSVQSATAS